MAAISMLIQLNRDETINRVGWLDSMIKLLSKRLGIEELKFPQPNYVQVF